MIVKWKMNGVDHESDWSGSPTTQEGRWIKSRMGWSTKQFLEALEELDADAIIALICIFGRREGLIFKWDEVDIDPIRDMEWIPTEDELARAREVEAASEVAQKGAGSPVPPELPIITPSGTPANGRLSAVASMPKSEPTVTNFGAASG